MTLVKLELALVTLLQCDLHVRYSKADSRLLWGLSLLLHYEGKSSKFYKGVTTCMFTTEAIKRSKNDCDRLVTSDF